MRQWSYGRMLVGKVAREVGVEGQSGGSASSACRERRAVCIRASHTGRLIFDFFPSLFPLRRSTATFRVLIEMYASFNPILITESTLKMDLIILFLR